MSHDEFTKLFKYIESFREEVKGEFGTFHKKLDNVDGRFDDLSKLIMEYHQEMLMLSHKVDRMERWIHQIADKTGVKLSFE